MNLLFEVLVLTWRAVESVLSIPQQLRCRLEADWLEWKRKQALDMVLTNTWPEGYNPKPLANLVLAAEEIELLDWIYGDRRLRIYATYQEVVSVHRRADGVYAVTDLRDVPEALDTQCS